MPRIWRGSWSAMTFRTSWSCKGPKARGAICSPRSGCGSHNRSAVSTCIPSPSERGELRDEIERHDSTIDVLTFRADSRSVSLPEEARGLGKVSKPRGVDPHERRGDDVGRDRVVAEEKHSGVRRGAGD